MEATDEAIAKLVQDGDVEAFGMLMKRYEGKLLRYAGRFLKDADSSAEVVQDSFVQAYRNIQSFNTDRTFSPWIYRIVHNQTMSHLRARRFLPLPELDTLLPVSGAEEVTDEAERTQTRAFLDAHIQTLPLQYQEVLALYYFEELEYGQIADVLRVPVGTVGVRLKRAREMLRKKIANTYI